MSEPESGRSQGSRGDSGGSGPRIVYGRDRGSRGDYGGPTGSVDRRSMAQSRYAPVRRNHQDSHEAYIAANAARSQATRQSDQAAYEAILARSRQQNREATSQWLASQGRTPFDDERNRRNAVIQGPWG